MGLSRELIALRVARELRDGMVVNLGIGIPTLVSDFIPPGVTVIFQAENGILGYGPTTADESEIDWDLINAGGQPVLLLPGACFFHSADSFAMIRGGHIDLSVLGGLQVSEKGDLANWMVPARGTGSIGGAMDLAVGARRLIVAMEHTTKTGEPRIVKECTYPLTAVNVVDLIVTNLAAIEVRPEGLVVTELAHGVSFDLVQSLSEPSLIPSPDLREMEL
ncbi:MAG: 3-oxoacid CoA-transferase subunit B [Dehalococcoidia bacterium]|nr:3-oxoacid CoA-transferase subunit B [Dehalococcoidia bacterium]